MRPSNEVCDMVGGRAVPAWIDAKGIVFALRRPKAPCGGRK